MFEIVSFKTKLQRGNRLQVPKLIRWRYKLESNQVLKANVLVLGLWGGPESFLVRMGEDGRIVVPKLILSLLKNNTRKLEGYVFQVTLEPT